MNVVTLASRMVARRRRMMLRSAIPIGFAAFVSVLGAAVLGAVGEQLLEVERTRISGEWGTRRFVPASGARSRNYADLPPGLLLSHAWVTPALSSHSSGTPSGSRITEIWFTDIPEEFAFRNLPPLPAEGSAEQSATTIAVTLTIPGLGTISPVAGSSVLLTGRPDVILIPWEEIPQSETSVDAMVGAEVIRVRGTTPISESALAQWAGERGLEPTGWAEAARRRMWDLRLLLAVIAGFLYLTGGGATAPSVGIMVRRYRGEFQLLSTIGYPDRYIRCLVATSGAIVAALTAGVGSVLAAILLTISSLSGGIDPSFLPLYWLESNPELVALAPGPPILAAVTAIVAATAVGALSALPASRVAANLGARRALWG